MRSRRIFLLVIAALALALPAYARPKSAAVTAIHRCNQTCDSTSIAQNDIVSGLIQIDVSASSNLVLDRVRLEAKPPSSNDYVCLAQWFGNQHTQLDVTFQWSTPIWPNPKYQDTSYRCPESVPHYHGLPAENGRYRVRVVAYDVRDQNETDSPDFIIQLANVPAAPKWQGTPTPSSNDGKPVVLLRWAPNLENDIAEYHFRRTDPLGHTVEFAVDAKNPAAQGCYKTVLFYGCPDSSFAGQSSGTYRYEILALRPTPGSSNKCGLSSQPCSASPPSDPQTASVVFVASSASTKPSPSSSASAAPHPSIVPIAISSYTPSPSATAFTTQASGARKKGSPWLWIAGLLIAGIAAGMFSLRLKERGARTKNPSS